ncbi:hypothetical protein ACFQE0_17665 [Methylobacterium komagatae]|uniref:Uncharacterized protein n=1 Tax=Methylobacterium komagatae TaxID=374425 RepID=A0ABW2BMF8_9HYPH
MTNTTQNDTGRAGRPFLRLLQPEQPNAPFKDSSYFRLGSYVAYNKEEDPLVTHLATTRSKVSGEPAMQGQSAADGVDLMGPDYSASFGAPSPGALTLEAIPSAPIASSNDGVLLYTDHDLNETVGGAVLQKYGQGHVTQVTDCDSAYSVLNGKHDLFAQNGINIHAGTKAAPSNIHIVAEGHMTQVAYGDLKGKVSGNTHKVYMGAKSDEFLGLKSTLMVGAESVVKLSASSTITVGLERSIRLGGRVTLTISIDENFTFGRQENTIVGVKKDAIIGTEFKSNVGDTFKRVSGLDQKYGNNDQKFLTGSDIKVVDQTDLKFTNRSISINNMSITKNHTDLEKSDYKDSKKEIETKAGKLLSEKVDAIKSVQAGMTMFL